MTKIDKIKLGNKYDQRRKLTEDHKREIRALYEQGEPIRGIAQKFKTLCSRRTIQFVLFPERLDRAKTLYKERRKDGRYYNKAKHRKVMKKYRTKKRVLYKQGLIG